MKQNLLNRPINYSNVITQRWFTKYLYQLCFVLNYSSSPLTCVLVEISRSYTQTLQATY